MGALKEDKEDLFDIADFDSVRVKVRIENQTSKTSVGGDTRTYGEQEVEADPGKVDIRLMEFQPRGLALDVPGKVGAVGHIVDIELDVQGAALPLCFKVRGKIAVIQALENDRERMDVELIEVNPRFLDALKSLFQKRQDEIDAFLASMRH